MKDDKVNDRHQRMYYLATVKDNIYDVVKHEKFDITADYSSDGWDVQTIENICKKYLISLDEDELNIINALITLRKISIPFLSEEKAKGRRKFRTLS